MWLEYPFQYAHKPYQQIFAFNCGIDQILHDIWELLQTLIGAIRVSFTNTPTSVWSDTVFHHWLNSAIPYSLAHFWFKSSFGQADLRYELFPPIVIDDPRTRMTAEEKKVWGKDREYLVNGVTSKITNDFHPAWGQYDVLLIWFAQQTDLFGGGAFPVPSGYLTTGSGLLDFVLGPEALDVLKALSSSQLLLLIF